MRKHMKLDRVAKTAEQGFIAGCCGYIGDIPDTVGQISPVAEPAILAESIDSIVKQVRRLEPSRLHEGVEA